MLLNDDITPTRWISDDEIALAEIEREWRKARIGNVTGSRIYDIVGRNKDKSYKATRRHYAREKLLERLTGVSKERIFTTPAIEWGNATEPKAVEEYEKQSQYFVYHMGRVFVPHPTIGHSGCSPDAYVGEIGGLEVKCPETDTHLDYLETGTIPIEYMPQVLWCLACTKREWWDFMSYDPRCPAHMDREIIRIWRDSYRKEIAALEEEVKLFLDELEFQVRKWEKWIPRSQENK